MYSGGQTFQQTSQQGVDAEPPPSSLKVPLSALSLLLPRLLLLGTPTLSFAFTEEEAEEEAEEHVDVVEEEEAGSGDRAISSPCGGWLVDG